MWRIKGDHKKVKHFIKEMKHLSTEEDAAYEDCRQMFTIFTL